MDFFLNFLRIAGSVFFLFTGVAVPAPIVYFAYASVTKSDPPAIPRATRIENIHSLAINPRDGTLFAGSPRGVFWIKNSEWAQRTNDSYQSTRGLIATGPDQFLGSGSADLRDIVGGWEPRFAGLIESQNAGRAWHTRSLKGEADFHTLDVKEGGIYGYDDVSQSFMVSSDRGRTWETRSQLEPLLDFAINPANVSQVFAVGDEGSLISKDGGRSWQQHAGPPLQHLAWPQAASFWGLDAEGNTYLSADAGQTWEQRTSLAAAPQAFLATETALYAAVKSEDGIVIHVSFDGGLSWQVHYRDPPRVTIDSVLP